MSKLKLIIKREFIAKVRNKSFVLMTFLMPLVMVGMTALIVFLSKKNTEDTKVIAYVDQSGVFNEALKDSKEIQYAKLTTNTLDEAKKLAQESKSYGLLYITKENTLEKTASSIRFFSEKSPGTTLINHIENQLAKKIRSVKYKELGIDEDTLKAARIKTTVNVESFSGEKTSKILNGAKIGIGSASGYLIMMFIIIYGNMVMRSVIEEKTSRIIEIIISSVKPFDLMLGKILGTSFAGLLQFFIWIILGFGIMTVAGLFFNLEPDVAQQTAAMQEMQQNIGGFNLTELINGLPITTIIISFILFFFGGFLLYSSIYAAIGAAVDNETDTQQFMFPVIMPLMLAVYVGFAAVMSDPHGPIAVFFSMFPLTSSIVMLMRIPFGVPLWQIITSLALLLFSFIGVVWFAAKIYRIGILMYGKKPSYKEIYKWLRKY